MRYPRPVVLAALAQAAEHGMTRRQAADFAGVCLMTVSRYACQMGLVFPRANASSRTRVAACKIEQRRRLARERRDAECLAEYGCTLDQYNKLRTGGARSPLRRYQNQRKSAGHRGIDWHLTLWQWWSVWDASGKWAQRGPGQGYVMCRVGDKGPYAVGNVFIASAASNSSEAQQKKTDLPIGVRRIENVGGAVYTATRAIGGRRYHLGTFRTPELAHAAYLAVSSRAAANNTECAA